MKLFIKRIRRPITSPAPWVFVVLASCQEPRDISIVTVADSAGIEIVQHPPGETVAVWRLMAGPDIRIGVREGESEYQFDNIVAALRQDNGRIVVLDRDRRRISVFGSDGKFIRASGRDGEGPGEYAEPSALWRIPGDSLAVYDAPRGRVSILTRDADWVRSVSVRPIRSLVQPNGSFKDGRLLVIDPFVDVLRRYGLAEALTVSTQGMNSMGEFKQIENIELGRMGAMPQPLIAQMRYMSAGNDWLFVVRNYGHELEVRNPNGDLRRLVRWHGRDLATTRESLDRYKQNRVGGVPEERRVSLAKALSERIPNERFPAFGRVVADRDGRAWLRSWRHPSDTGPSNWTVVNATGEIEAELEVPYGSDVLEADDEYLLLRLADEFGVQSVALYAIDRDGSS